MLSHLQLDTNISYVRIINQKTHTLEVTEYGNARGNRIVHITCGSLERMFRNNISLDSPRSSPPIVDMDTNKVSFSCDCTVEAT
jgi:hypothetical protein